MAPACLPDTSPPSPAERCFPSPKKEERRNLVSKKKEERITPSPYKTYFLKSYFFYFFPTVTLPS
jgi:hypothetical protein